MWLTIAGQDVEARPGATLAEVCACLGVDPSEMWCGQQRASPAAVTGLHPLTPGAAVTAVPEEPTSTPATPYLEVLSGASAGRLRELRNGLTIGRDGECGLPLDDAAVSARHAVVTGPPWRLRDTGSRNGIGGLGRSRRLHDGDLLTIGDSTLLARLSEPPADSAPVDARSRAGPWVLTGTASALERATARRRAGSAAPGPHDPPRWADLDGAWRHWVIGRSGRTAIALDTAASGPVIVTGADAGRVRAAVELLRLSLAATRVAGGPALATPRRRAGRDAVLGSDSPGSLGQELTGSCAAVVCLAGTDPGAAQRLLGMRSIPALESDEAIVRQGTRLARVTLATPLADPTPAAWRWGEDPPEGRTLAQAVAESSSGRSTESSRAA